MNPRISICVPNLNTRPFLPERFQTIFEQSFENWELLVYDSYSDDGAWEYIRSIAAREPRMRAWQGPRQGAPGSWNPCIREAHGDYVYIATSDDTMPPDCLRKLVAALDANPHCDIAHCPVRVIDEKGQDVASMCEWWWKHSPLALSSGTLVDRPHVRYAPLDGVLHLLGRSVYTSITQLLIRRTLFDRIGFFEPTWGSVGDFNWNMRAGLVANTVHVPDTWGGWRVHANQATAGAGLGSPEHARKIDEMIEHAVRTTGDDVAPPAQQRVKSEWLPHARQLRTFEREVAGYSQPLARRAFVLRRMLAGSAPARLHVVSALLGRSFEDWVMGWLEDEGTGPMLVAAPTARADTDREALAFGVRT